MQDFTIFAGRIAMHLLPGPAQVKQLKKHFSDIVTSKR